MINSIYYNFFKVWQMLILFIFVSSKQFYPFWKKKSHSHLPFLWTDDDDDDDDNDDDDEEDDDNDSDEVFLQNDWPMKGN